MHKSLLTGSAVAVAVTLLAAAPASAATEPVTTVTTHSVPADTAIAIPSDYDTWGDANRFVAPGAVTFPLDAEQYDGDLTHDTFSMSARAAEGCVRVVESFTFGYTLADYNPNSTDSVFVMGGVGTGDPLVLAPLALGDATQSVEGLDLELLSEARVGVELPIHVVPAAQSGDITITFPVPVGQVEARGYIGFDMPSETTWVVDHALFLVTDTCTTTAGTAADSSATLPKTGVDGGLAATAAALLLGTGFVALLLARRRARRA